MAGRKKTEIDLYKAFDSAGISIVNAPDQKLANDICTYADTFVEQHDNIDLFSQSGFRLLRDELSRKFGVNGDHEKAADPVYLDTMFVSVATLANRYSYSLLMGDVWIFLGMSDRGSDWVARNDARKDQFFRWREYVRDVLEHAAIAGSVGAIFILKATYGYRDQDPIQLVDSRSTSTTMDDIEKIIKEREQREKASRRSYVATAKE